jgi:hypothetical protein
VAVMAKASRIATVAAVMLLAAAFNALACGSPERSQAAAAKTAAAEPIWIIGTKLSKSAAENELVFTVTIPESGAYQVVLEAQGGVSEDYLLNLVVVPEQGGASQRARFAFAGLDCG